MLHRFWYNKLGPISFYFSFTFIVFVLFFSVPFWWIKMNIISRVQTTVYIYTWLHLTLRSPSGSINQLKLCHMQWRIHQGNRGTCPPNFKPRGTVMQKSPPRLSQRGLSQSLGLPAYACKTDSSTAIKLPPRMNAPKLAILRSKIEKNPGRAWWRGVVVTALVVSTKLLYAEPG